MISDGDETTGYLGKIIANQGEMTRDQRKITSDDGKILADRVWVTFIAGLVPAPLSNTSELTNSTSTIHTSTSNPSLNNITQHLFLHSPAVIIFLFTILVRACQTSVS